MSALVETIHAPLTRAEFNAGAAGQGKVGVFGVDLLSGVGDEAQTAAIQELEPEVASSFSPLIGLLGQDRADEADDGVPVRNPPSRRANAGHRPPGGHEHASPSQRPDDPDG